MLHKFLFYLIIKLLFYYFSEVVDVVDAVAKAMVGTTSILAQEGDPNMCPRCKGKVFEAEKIQSNRGMFHKNCFKCIDCHRALDPSLVFDGFQVSPDS